MTVEEAVEEAVTTPPSEVGVGSCLTGPVADELDWGGAMRPVVPIPTVMLLETPEVVVAALRYQSTFQMLGMGLHVHSQYERGWKGEGRTWETSRWTS